MVNFYIGNSNVVTAIPNDKKPKFFSFGIPTYTNLGDQAVSWAQKRYIENEFPEYEFIEILEEDTEAAIKEIQKVIQPPDIVSFVGGGNMGSLYLDHEIARRRVFESFTDNLTISFPQSIHFEENQHGEIEKKKSQEAYEKNPNLYLVARDAQSYHRMQQTFKNHVLFTPDMVLYLQPKTFNEGRSGALFVFRQDSEKVVDDQLISSLKKVLNNGKRSIEQTDTVLDTVDRITPESRRKLFKDELELFSNQEIVITDRWHAMVFSVLTGTPCLLFGNSYGKGKHAYFDWLEHIDWIDYTDEDDLERLTPQIKHLLTLTKHPYDVRNDFNQLDKLIENHSKKFSINR